LHKVRRLFGRAMPEKQGCNARKARMIQNLLYPKL